MDGFTVEKIITEENKERYLITNKFEVSKSNIKKAVNKLKKNMEFLPKNIDFIESGDYMTDFDKLQKEKLKVNEIKLKKLKEVYDKNLLMSEETVKIIVNEFFENKAKEIKTIESMVNNWDKVTENAQKQYTEKMLSDLETYKKQLEDDTKTKEAYEKIL